jgi:hypothetical protein
LEKTMSNDTSRRDCIDRIDFNFYRARAAAERSAAQRRLASRLAKTAHLAFGQAAILATLWSLPGRPWVSHVN